MTLKFLGLSSWELDRDQSTFRNYKAKFLVLSDDLKTGPYEVLNCPNLPQIGDTWSFGNDTDSWAHLHPDATVRYKDAKEGESQYVWEVEMKYSTNPITRCSDTQFTDPLQEPQKLRGSFVKYTQEFRYDRFGNFLCNSALEPLRGADVEFDCNRPNVIVEQNKADLALPTITQMVDTVNGFTLWGLPPRCIKLSDVSWERKVQGTCQFYFTRNLTFDINFDTFDRPVADFGSMVLKGKWVGTGYVVDAGASRFNPQHFVKYTDRVGNIASVVLNGYGLPAGTSIHVGTGSSSSASGPIAQAVIQRYSESDFTLLGIPTNFNLP